MNKQIREGKKGKEEIKKEDVNKARKLSRTKEDKGRK
jgi:hypothetical protein